MSEFIQVTDYSNDWVDMNRRQDIRCRRLSIETYCRSLQDVLAAIQLGRFRESDKTLLSEHLKLITQQVEEIIGLADGSIPPSFVGSQRKAV